MKVFRLIKEKDFTENLSFLKTEFSKIAGGRWNDGSHGVLYTADSIETAVAECGTYWILRNAEQANYQVNGKMVPGFEEIVSVFEKAVGIIAEIEIDEGKLKLLDLIDESVLAQYLKQANLEDILPPRHLRHSYRSRGMQTKKFARWLLEKGYDGFRVGSARNPAGTCTVIFEPNTTLGALTVINTIRVEMFGLKADGMRVDGKPALYDINTFEYEINTKTQTSTPSKIEIV